MADHAVDMVTCPICHQKKPEGEGRPAELVHGPIGELIRKELPDWAPGQIICLSCLNRFRTEYVEDVLELQHGDLTSLEESVIDTLKEQELISRNVEAEFDRKLTFGERLADHVADFGGSWKFILIFTGILFVWIVINSIYLLRRPFDPYPYILLNLVLSCLAAVQAPIIMMSQNRQEDKDRLRSQHDYQVNLKAEIEIRQLHIKMDQLINNSWQRLLEIQQIQTELLQDMADLQRKKDSE